MGEVHAFGRLIVGGYSEILNLVARVALALLVGVVVVIAGSASAQSSHVAITRAEADGTHPSVSWTLAPGWCSNVIAVARSPQTGSDGSFFSENVIDGGILDEQQTSWLSSSPSVENPGTYYVRVQAYQCDFLAGPEWSATATIVKQPPSPPPPPPTPMVAFTIKAEGYNGYDTTGVVTKLRVGKRYWITATARGTQSDLNTLNAGDTKLCVAKRRGKVCGDLLFYPLKWDNIITRIAPSMVVGNRVTVFVEFEGKRLASKRYRLAR